MFHVDATDWRDTLAAALDAELRSIGMHRTIDLLVRDGEPPPHRAPAVGVYLGSRAGATDTTVTKQVTHALCNGMSIVPVVDNLDHFSDSVPLVLRPINGFEWRDDSSARRLARLLLEELGIQEVKRRVFISHKREDGLAAAEQMHDKLSHAGFTPFIDRFAIRAGCPVQQTIADSLEEYAFLLVLETPLAHTSDWVFDEVDYALSHTMGSLIVSWPGEPTPVPGSDGLPRVHLTERDLKRDAHDYEVLTEDALDRVINEIEAAHAYGLVRRRRMLVRSTEEAAIAAGCVSCVALPGWRLRIDDGATITVVGTAPRLPTAEDLNLLDDAALEYAPATAVLVHSARILRDDLRRHLEWVVGSRNLTLTPENAIGARWRCP